MQKIINIGNKEIAYTLKSSKRSRRIRICIYGDGCLVVTKPQVIPAFMAERLVRKKKEWIASKIKNFQKINSSLPKSSRAHYLKHKETARQFILERIKYFCNLHDFGYNQVRIKNQKTCWGSCSSKGNLNFNYKILFLPPTMADYVIAHELCHLKELNHSRNFWLLVGRLVPEYASIRKEMKKGWKIQ